jgi:Homeodomain-like domain
MLSELKDYIQSNPDARELKRAVAVQMFLNGYKHREIQESLSVSSGFISKWTALYGEQGVQGLKLKYLGSTNQNGTSPVSGLHPMTPSKIQLRTFGYTLSVLSESGTIFANLFVLSRLYLSLHPIDKYLISLSCLLMAASHESFRISITILTASAFYSSVNILRGFCVI